MPKRTRSIRNPVAVSPLLRKGGPHIRSKTGERFLARLSTCQAYDEWMETCSDDDIHKATALHRTITKE